MCSACVVKAGKRKAKAAEGAETGQEQAGKRKAKAAEGAGTGQSKRPNTKGGVLSASRKRLTIQEKVQILQLLDKRTSHEHIADRFNCSERLVRKVKAEREVVEKEAATGGGALKTKRRGDFPEVRHTPLLQHCFFFGSSCLLFFVVVFCIILVFLFVTSFLPFFSRSFLLYVPRKAAGSTAVIWFVCVHRIYSSTPVQNQFCTYFFLQSTIYRYNSIGLNRTVLYSTKRQKEKKRRKRMVATRARNAGGTPHRPTLNYRLTSGSWRVQRRKVATQTPHSTCRKPGWR